MPCSPVLKLILLNSVLAGPANSALDPTKKNANAPSTAIQTQPKCTILQIKLHLIHYIEYSFLLFLKSQSIHKYFFK